MTPMEHRTPRTTPAAYGIPAATAAIAAGIFVLDTVTRITAAVPVLYVAVILMAARFLKPRGLLLVAAGCVALTVLSFILSRGPGDELVASFNDMLGFSAIAITTFLVLRNQAAEAKAFQQLQGVRDQLRLLIDTVPALVWTRFPDGSVDFLNRRFREYTGLSPEEGAGQGWMNAIHPDDRPRFETDWRTAVTSGRMPEIEARLRRADGEYRWFLNRAAPLRDEHGSIVRWYATNIDIEDRKRAEAALREQAGLLDLTHDTIIVRDMNDVITYWNRGAEDMYGWTRQEAVGRVSHDLTRTEFPAPLGEIREELIRTGRWEGELVQARRDGTSVTVASRWSLQRDEQGRPARILETNNDITARKRAEEALRQAQEDLARVNRVTTLGALAASIAHEVNQPLGAVVTSAASCSRWLAAEPPDLEKARQALDRIVRDGTRASEIIVRVRALATKRRPRRDLIDVNETVLEVIALTRDEVQRHGVVLQTRLAEGLPRVPGDKVQLQQVILNLIVNAIEAMSGIGEGQRELLVVSANDGPKGVLVAVRDSGKGLDPAAGDHLFDAFYTTKGEGIGMGLAISRSIVEAHGGRLWAADSEPHGAVFQFSLPVDDELP